MQGKQEIIYEKSRKNLKKVFNRLNGRDDGAAKHVGMEEVLFLAMGGYNRTYELLISMGLNPTDIATFSSLKLTDNFVKETHLKKVLYIKKINYLTKVDNYGEATQRYLNLNVADEFEESLLVYKHAHRFTGVGAKKVAWVKPTVVVMDDPSLNLQFSGHRLRYANFIGFVQVKNRNASPYNILSELKEVEEADKMMFAMYQKKELDDQVIMDALNQLRMNVNHELDGKWYIKPSDYKRIVGSNEVANGLKEIKELDITQLKNNKRIGSSVSRWVVIPEEAFNFQGFEYKDEDEIFEEEIRAEEERERMLAERQEKMLEEIMSIELPLNVQAGYIRAEMGYLKDETLQSFIDATDELSQDLNPLELLEGATTQEEYDEIKKKNLAYFLDGNYANNRRSDDNYQGGRRLVVLDVDDGEYTRSQIEDKLESNGLFGIVYPTARYYFDGSQRWRLILMADEEMDKENYKYTTRGVAEMLGLEADSASSKISQLMGYPLASKDISTVIGTMVSVSQFKPEHRSRIVENVVRFRNNNFESAKSLRDFKHKQADLLNRALETGIPKGERNESYYQIIRFLRDTQSSDEFSQWHEEAAELEDKIISQMYTDGLSESEVELLCR